MTLSNGSRKVFCRAAPAVGTCLEFFAEHPTTNLFLHLHTCPAWTAAEPHTLRRGRPGLLRRNAGGRQAFGGFQRGLECPKAP